MDDMQKDDLQKTVIGILTGKAGLPPGPVTPEATLTEAGVDSMAVAVLAMVIEDEYGLVITEADLSANSTVADLAALIGRHLAAKA
ncbi:acyl carrier protein [Streptomyces telluris]|uniref:Acyl carrier protein n=1 Tax=Streptomyces telluris TaxID=2720021 RepID=A0A9X2LLA6_9ACTN|nr:acyl carrier protein [Streptomyces telluris]MCQ8771905.1 acyl carrier protein [Streptomyces telluris]NJP79414.1 acyl carrier protein [Streptomyces telluris]